jgi:streptogramin lyase
MPDPYLVEGGGSVWMVDDCSGILAEVDPATGDYVDAWSLPTDGESDQDIGAVAMGDGIWFVDVGQTGEPYRFDFSARRFERMPIAREDAEPIYALVWDVMAGP